VAITYCFFCLSLIAADNDIHVIEWIGSAAISLHSICVTVIYANVHFAESQEMCKMQGCLSTQGSMWMAEFQTLLRMDQDDTVLCHKMSESILLDMCQ